MRRYCVFIQAAAESAIESGSHHKYAVDVLMASIGYLLHMRV